MRYVLVSDDDFLWELLPPSTLPGDPPLYAVEQTALRRRIVRSRGHAISGKLEDERLYRRAFRSGTEPVLVAVPPARHAAVVAAIRRVAPSAPVLLLSERSGSRALSGVTLVSPAEFARRVIAPGLERAVTRARVDRIRDHFAGAGRVLIMLQDDPDPDAIASALALRALLGRSSVAAPIATFGSITRPENRAMTLILEIDVEQIKARDVDDYDMVAMVDVQPSFFEEREFPVVDLVIDHHPEETPVRAALKDIRPSYGATSTILTEYLRAVEARFTPRLATALLYAIKTDTRNLERGTTRADVDAFAFLHRLANHRALSRIERPQFPEDALDLFARSIQERTVRNGVVFSHLGAVAYPELVPQFADLFLQIERADWVVISGTVNGEIHISVRNVGHVQAAGDVVRQAFGDLGSAGGHRSMAKAVVPLRDWEARVGDAGNAKIAEAIVTRFERALKAAG